MALKSQGIIKYIFQSGVGVVSNCGFSHRRSCPRSKNTLLKPLCNKYETVVANYEKEMRITSIILFLLISINSFCQWQQTEGPITNISISDIVSCDSALIASAPCGTFISTDNGNSWSPVNPANFNAHVIFKNELYLGGESIRKVLQINEDWIESYSLYKKGKTSGFYT